MKFSNDTNTSLAIKDETSSATYLAVALPLGIVGMTGFTAHIFVVLCTIRSKHPISLIIASVSFAEAMLCAYDGLWISTSYALQQPLGTREGLFTVYIFFGASTNCEIVLALNRYIATWRPQKYKTTFSPKRTRIYLVSSWIIALITCIPYGIPSCRFVIDYKMFRIAYEETVCGTVVSLAAETFGMVSVSAIVLNILTLSKLRKSRRALKAAIKKEEVKRRSKRELSFFIQSCVTSITTCLILATVDYIPMALHDRWSFYAVNSLMPIIFISIEGIVILYLNAETKTALKAALLQLNCVKEFTSKYGKRAGNNGTQMSTMKTDATSVIRKVDAKPEAGANNVPGIMPEVH